jgi:hypothetical protein
VSGSSAQIELAKKMNSAARSKMTRSAGLAATYRPPARIASPTCSRGSTRAGGVPRHQAMTAMTARNVAALIKKTMPAVVAARTIPPIAGTRLSHFQLLWAVAG